MYHEAMALSEADQQLIQETIREELSKHRMTYSRAVSGSFQGHETEAQERRREFWMSLGACGLVGAGWIVTAGVGYLAFIVHPDFTALPVIGSLGGSIAAAMATAYVNRELFGDVEIVEDEPVAPETLLPTEPLVDAPPHSSTVEIIGVMIPTASLRKWVTEIEAGNRSGTIDDVRGVLSIAQRTVVRLTQAMRQHGWIHDGQVTAHGLKCLKALLPRPSNPPQPDYSRGQ